MCAVARQPATTTLEPEQDAVEDSCPDWENPCKHIAAVLYVFADQLDSDAWLVLKWRGRTREQILEPFLGAISVADRDDEVAPWWPFAPGPLPQRDHDGAALVDADAAVPPDQPDAVLDALAPLDARVGDNPVVELLRPVYAHIVESSLD